MNLYFVICILPLNPLLGVMGDVGFEFNFTIIILRLQQFQHARAITIGVLIITSSKYLLMTMDVATIIVNCTRQTSTPHDMSRDHEPRPPPPQILCRCHVVRYVFSRLLVPLTVHCHENEWCKLHNRRL